MRRFEMAVLASLCLAVLASCPLAMADDVPHGPVNWISDIDWTGQHCRYPGPNPARMKGNRTSAALRPQQVAEIEGANGPSSNDTLATAQFLTIAPGPVDPVDIDVSGVIWEGKDVDLYRWRAKKGDIIGLAVLSQSALDPVLGIEQTSGVMIVQNDNNGGMSLSYPGISPLPQGVGQYDAELSWIAPADGDYLIRVSSYASASRGAYTMQIRARRSGGEMQAFGQSQILFLDFDGASFSPQQVFYGLGNSTANLSPLRDFLPYWGFAPEDEADLEQAIIDCVQRTLDRLAIGSLNGNLETDGVPGHFKVQLLNSRDHADPWGQPNASRIIVGGTVYQLGISTIGISGAIDPGNFSLTDTAVVLLDLLSNPVDLYVDYGYPKNPDSANSVGYVSGYGGGDSDHPRLDKIRAVGETIGHIVSHEMGHFLGCWHQDTHNDVVALMDAGPRPIWIDAGAGNDGILGTADDEPCEFIVDSYYVPLRDDDGSILPGEEYIADGEEQTDVVVAFALSSGRVRSAQVEDPGTSVLLHPSIRASATGGSPPLTVQFFGGTTEGGANYTFSWNFDDGSAAVTGDVVSHEFTASGSYLVRLTVTDSSGTSGLATVLITVSTVLPTAQFTASPSRGQAPLTVTFDASTSVAAVAGGTITGYAWDFGDNTSNTGKTVQHTYNSPGYYACKLTVTDSGGNQSTASQLITVTGTAAVNADSAQETPTTNTTAAPQCGFTMTSEIAACLSGMLALMGMRKRK